MQRPGVAQRHSRRSARSRIVLIALAALRALAKGRDPETLIGPLYPLFTRVAVCGDADARGSLADHLTVLAAHPALELHLRLAAGSLVLEHWCCGDGRVAAHAAQDEAG